MLQNLAFGLSTMIACLVMQAAVLIGAMRYRSRWTPPPPTFWSTMRLLCGAMLLLIGGIFGQVALWALLFRALGEFDAFPDAFYHSAVNFATLGYGDVVMSPRHRVLGPVEAINGALMVGVSTAALMVVMQQAARRLFSTPDR